MAEDTLDFQYDNYRKSTLGSSYSRSEGLLVIPVMGPEGTAPVVVRVHASFGVRTVSFDYAKQASPPLFPAIQDSQSNDILLSADLMFPAPITDGQQQLVFGVRGSYEYVQPGGGRTQGDAFPIDAHPFATKIDMLGEMQTDITNPDVNFVWGQWNQDEVDTAVLTATRIIG